MATNNNIDLQSTSLVPHWARRDPIRDERRVRLGLRMRMAHYLVPDFGLALKRNENTQGLVIVDTPVSEASKVYADVETDFDALAQAKRTHERKMREFVSQTSGTPIKDLAGDVSTWSDEDRRVLNTYAGSVEAQFCALTGRGINPLHEVVDLGFVETAEEKKEASEVESLRAELAELKALIKQKAK